MRSDRVGWSKAIDMGCRDFDAPTDPPRPADVSAANLAAYALLTLSEQESSINNATGARYYADAAIKVREYADVLEGGFIS